MPRFLTLITLLLTSLANAAAPATGQAEWEYIRIGKNEGNGTLTVRPKSGKTYVSVKQFCFALGCKAFYQWASHKAIIQNPDIKRGAVVSSITHIALVDGKIVDFEGDVLSDLREGYLLPINLAMKLASTLGLGRIVRHEAVKPPLAPARNQLGVIVIDAGHGGNDLGTLMGAIYEKDVAVIYATKLRDELKRAMPDLEVVMTRDSDRYVSLPDRAKIANQKGAHFFLSLHVNHAPNPRVEGAETYILNPEATDDDAKKTALLENETWLKSSGIKASEGDTVQKILVDMEQTKYIQESALAASLIQQELGKLEPQLGLKSRGVKQAMFYVLSQVAMPSALVEMGFLSSTGDRGRLMNVAFRDEFVKSVVNAIKLYRARVSGASQ